MATSANKNPAPLGQAQALAGGEPTWANCGAAWRCFYCGPRGPIVPAAPWREGAGGLWIARLGARCHPFGRSGFAFSFVWICFFGSFAPAVLVTRPGSFFCFASALTTHSKSCKVTSPPGSYRPRSQSLKVGGNTASALANSARDPRRFVAVRTRRKSRSSLGVARLTMLSFDSVFANESSGYSFNAPRATAGIPNRWEGNSQIGILHCGNQSSENESSIQKKRVLRARTTLAFFVRSSRSLVFMLIRRGASRGVFP